MALVTELARHAGGQLHCLSFLDCTHSGLWLVLMRLGWAEGSVVVLSLWPVGVWLKPMIECEYSLVSTDM